MEVFPDAYQTNSSPGHNLTTKYMCWQKWNDDEILKKTRFLGYDTVLLLMDKFMKIQLSRRHNIAPVLSGVSYTLSCFVMTAVLQFIAFT